MINAILLALAHIHKMYYYYDVWGPDVPTIMMMNLCRMTSISCNYRDGSIPKDRQETDLKSRKLLYFILASWLTVTIGERAYAIEKLPSFYEYIAYMYYCGGTIAGPFYEYKDYLHFIERSNNYAAIPSTFIPAMIRLSHAISKFLTA